MTVPATNLIYGFCAFAVCFALVFVIAYIKNLCLKLVERFSRKTGENG